MTLAVCLLTADREHYTAITLRSFLDHNRDGYGMIRLHADDGSASELNERMAEGSGFLTCYRSKTRQGVIPALRYMWNLAYEMGASHILHLENDLQSVAPLPTRRDAASVRMYGVAKGANGSYPTGPHIMGTKQPIDWRPDGAGWERALCHWGAQPSITRASILVEAINQAESLKDVSRALLRIDTVRPRWNIMNHIGEQKTTGARFSA